MLQNAFAKQFNRFANKTQLEVLYHVALQIAQLECISKPMD